MKKQKLFPSAFKICQNFCFEHEFSIRDKEIDNLNKPVTIGYHAACHLYHAQGIKLSPKLLLEKFAQFVNTKKGNTFVKLVPLIDEEQCCGSAGIYNLGHPILSEKILARKIEMIKNASVDIIVTTNPGCILQLASGVKQQGLNIQVLHLASLLSKAYLNTFSI